jgi:hypothetical protein
MNPSQMRHFDFDPYGRTRTELARWEREVEVMSLRSAALETKGSDAQPLKLRNRLNIRIRLPHMVRHLSLGTQHIR